MTIHAADLLDESLRHTQTAARLPAAAELLEGFEEALARQQDVYDQILLPRLGLGERFDLCAQTAELADVTWEFRGGEIWLFDARPPASWLHAPLLAPFEDLNDTLLLMRRADVPLEIAARLRPPVVSGVSKALNRLDWLIVDSGGYEGGRITHEEFLDEIGTHRWYRIDHDAQTGATRFEHWRGEDAQTGWAANVIDSFETEIDLRPGWDSPVNVADQWTTDPHTQPFETAVALDLLDDPYAQLRRLVWHDARLDINRLGPLVTWKDRPDALFEFDDLEDSLLADPAAWLGAQFEVASADIELLVDDWFERICDHVPVEVPGVGTLRQVILPAVELIRPRPLVGSEGRRMARLQRRRLYAATEDDPADWLA